MGKVRIKTFDEGSEEIRKPKKNKKAAATTSNVAESVADNLSDSVVATATAETQKDKKPQEKGKAKSASAPRQRSKNYQTIASLVDKNKIYSLKEALEVLPKLKRAKFDETIELHLTADRTGISLQTTLPYGTGKEIKVAIADPSAGHSTLRDEPSGSDSKSSGQAQLDELIKKIESGSVDFDILLATPDAMPKLAKVAKILGPRGLMPNPKNGTITEKPEEAAKKFKEGQISIKTEGKFPIIHLTVGKSSFGKEKLEENIKTVFSAMEKENLKKTVLKSTMSPAIKIQV